mgnify:FL=1
MNAMTSAERFAVALTPAPTVARIAKQRSALRLQVIVAVVFGAVLLLVWLGPMFLPEDAGQAVRGVLPSWSLPALAVIWAAPTLARIILTAGFLERAKQDLASLGQGAALYIDGTGVEFVHPEQVRARWAEITALKISGRSWGAGPRLRLEVSGREVASIPVSFLDAMPGAIDSAARARSMGRIGVDASDMDRLL